MSREPENLVLAPIRIAGLPETFCFTSMADLFKALQTYAYAEITSEITNVHVGNIQPDSTQRLDAWFRLSADGKFIGIYMFDGSTWQQVLPAPQEIFWMYGNPDSGTLPTGFKLVDNSNSHFTTLQVTHIQSFFYPTPGTPPYTYFACTFEGF